MSALSDAIAELRKRGAKVSTVIGHDAARGELNYSVRMPDSVPSTQGRFGIVRCGKAYAQPGRGARNITVYGYQERDNVVKLLQRVAQEIPVETSDLLDEVTDLRRMVADLRAERNEQRNKLDIANRRIDTLQKINTEQARINRELVFELDRAERQRDEARGDAADQRDQLERFLS